GQDIENRRCPHDREHERAKQFLGGGGAHAMIVTSSMSRLEGFFGYAESHRAAICGLAVVLVGVIAWADANLPTMSIGFLYLFPILISGAALNAAQIVALALLCSILREAYDPLVWSAGATGRILVAGAGFAMAGFFVTG